MNIGYILVYMYRYVKIERYSNAKKLYFYYLFRNELEFISFERFYRSISRIYTMLIMAHN